MANFPLPSSGLPISMSMLKEFAPFLGSTQASLSHSFASLTGSVEYTLPYEMSFYGGKTVYHYNITTGSGEGVVNYNSPFSSSQGVTFKLIID